MTGRNEMDKTRTKIKTIKNVDWGFDPRRSNGYDLPTSLGNLLPGMGGQKLAGEFDRPRDRSVTIFKPGNLNRTRAKAKTAGGLNLRPALSCAPLFEFLWGHGATSRDFRGVRSFFNLFQAELEFANSVPMYNLLNKKPKMIFL
jgi:hypothetical protein